MSRQVYTCDMRVYATVTVHDPAVVERITGPGGDEWRSRFYDLHTAEDVIEHFVFNAVTNGVHDISRLEGWADADPAAVTIEIDDTELLAARDWCCGRSAERRRGVSGEGSWIVLGDPGISYGPFPKAEALAFAAQYPTRMALSLDAARSQLETCVKYGLDFKPAARPSAAAAGEDAA